jgi:hypothetical protein
LPELEEGQKFEARLLEDRQDLNVHAHLGAPSCNALDFGLGDKAAFEVERLGQDNLQDCRFPVAAPTNYPRSNLGPDGTHLIGFGSLDRVKRVFEVSVWTGVDDCVGIVALALDAYGADNLFDKYEHDNPVIFTRMFRPNDTPECSAWIAANGGPWPEDQDRCADAFGVQLTKR